MLVSHFNSFLSGGASTAAQLLHKGLLRRGVESRFQHLVGEQLTEQDISESDQKGFYPTQWDQGEGWQKALRAIRYRVHREGFKRSTRGAPEGAEIFTSPHGKPNTPWPPVGHPAENRFASRQHVIHLHWVSKFIDFPSFFGSLTADQPVVWTLHDMNALTGGCHFSGGCERFRLGCGNCPQLKHPKRTDVSHQSFQTKRKALSGVNLHVVAPSRWLIKQAQSSPLLADARSFNHIPYGMPTDALYPVSKRVARELLGLDPDKFVIGFGAMDLGSRRKGGAELIDALQSVATNPDVRCLVFGSGKFGEATESLPPVIDLGRLDNDRIRRLVYSAADVFVLPSTEDNLPLTGLEAMACGTPVVGFDAGGIPDYVIPGKTGLLAPKGDSQRLGQRLAFAAQNISAMRAMGDRSRQLIMEEFELSLSANRYTSLYEAILGVSKSAQRRAA